MQAPEELVWQTRRVSGRLRGNSPNGVSVGVSTTKPGAPMSIAAVAITPIPFTPLIAMLPSWVKVSTMDSISGIGVALAVSRNVLSPATLGAGLGVLLHWYASAISCAKAADGVMAK